MSPLRAFSLVLLLVVGCGDDGPVSADAGPADPVDTVDAGGAPRLCVAVETGSSVQVKEGGQTVDLPAVIAGGILALGPARSAALQADFMLELHFSAANEWTVGDLQACSQAGPDDPSCAERDLVSVWALIESGAEMGDHAATMRLLDGTTVDATLSLDGISDDPLSEGAAVWGAIDYKQGRLTVQGEFGTPFCQALLGATI